MKVISFCLWGNNPKYTVGAIKNIELAKQHYPEWICRFYCDNVVPKDIKDTIKNNDNCELVEVDVTGDWKFTTNRFLPFSETGVEYVISRDTDSRISEREVAAVEYWIQSGKDAHIMKDHPYHGGFPMLAGMIGIKGGVIKNVSALLSLYKNQEQYHYDQIFLAKFIYPFIEDSVIIHDEFFNNEPFPTKRQGLDFVGQVFDEYDEIVPEHLKSLKESLENES